MSNVLILIASPSSSRSVYTATLLRWIDDWPMSLTSGYPSQRCHKLSIVFGAISAEDDIQVGFHTNPHWYDLLAHVQTSSSQSWHIIIRSEEPTLLSVESSVTSLSIQCFYFEVFGVSNLFRKLHTGISSFDLRNLCNSTQWRLPSPSASVQCPESCAVALQTLP